jgi:hypothetical protein
MPPNTKNKRNAGGAAAQAGINFQNRVAAWVAVRILCESSGAGIFGLAGIPSLVRCETEQPVDDLLVGTSASSFAFLNVKHSLDLSSAANSTLGTVVHQFVRQILTFRGAQGSRPWERINGSNASRSIAAYFFRSYPNHPSHSAKARTRSFGTEHSLLVMMYSTVCPGRSFTPLPKSCCAAIAVTPAFWYPSFSEQGI